MIIEKLYRLVVRVERYIKFFLSLLGLLGTGQNNRAHLIICGVPRSGTSLFFNMLSSTLKDFKCYYGYKSKNNKSRESSALNAITRSGNYITKMPDDLLNLEAIQKFNVRRKKIIVFILVRDFRDVVTSKHQWGNGEYYLGMNEKITIHGTRMNNRGLVHYLKVVDAYNNNNKINSDKNTFVIIIKYEELINNPGHIIHILNEHKIDNYGIEAFLNYKSVYHTSEKSSKGKQKLFERWMQPDHKERIATQFSTTESRDYLIKYGYETSHEWYNEYK